MYAVQPQQAAAPPGAQKQEAEHHGDVRFINEAIPPGGQQPRRERNENAPVAEAGASTDVLKPRVRNGSCAM